MMKKGKSKGPGKAFRRGLRLMVLALIQEFVTLPSQPTDLVTPWRDHENVIQIPSLLAELNMVVDLIRSVAFNFWKGQLFPVSVAFGVL